MVLIDELRYPFSLFSAIKFQAEQFKTERVGTVEQKMDAEIKRMVYKISGSVSANNYVDLTDLDLTGQYVYFQIKLFKPKIATIHLEVLTTTDIPLRITLSSLYSGDSPRFLGRSLRLPMPDYNGWTTITVDLVSIMETFCISGGAALRYKAIRRVQVCSTMLIRDVVTADRDILTGKKALPKELAVKTDFGLNGMVMWNAFEECVALSTSTMKSKPKTSSRFSGKPQNAASSPSISEIPGRTEDLDSTIKTVVTKDTIDEVVVEPVSAIVQEQTCPSPQIAAGNAAKYKKTVPEGFRTGSPGKVHDAGYYTGPPANIMRQTYEDTPQRERVLRLERVLNYAGGTALTLYDGKLLLVASGTLLVLADIAGAADTEDYGFWKAFRQTEETNSMAGYRQAFVTGHKAAIGIIEVSPGSQFLITSETCAGAALILWDVPEGKKLASWRPHAGGVTAVAFSADCAMIVTAGIDAHRRAQIIVWDVNALLESPVASSNVPDATISSNCPKYAPFIIAKQISEWPITRIAFSPYEDQAICSCGRENVRFWRIRRGHLPGRPVSLNEFGRGFIFTSIGFLVEPGDMRKMPQIAFFASNRGLLLKVDCLREHVICAYQLHSGAITSLLVTPHYAVTGGADSRLRVWPLDFSDFQLEAHHEGAVTNTTVSPDGKKLTVGTSSGTLGILDVSEHSYNTIVRSHAGAIMSVAAKGSNGDEFVTVGADRTIRIWDTISAQQRFEFMSAEDQPRCATFHTRGLHVLACGFDSGTIRVFDVETTSTIVERHAHSAAITSIEYAAPAESTLLLFSAGLDGLVVAYDALADYVPMKALSVALGVGGLVPKVHMAVDSTQTLLAAATDTIGSVVLFDTVNLLALYKNGNVTVATRTVTGQEGAGGMQSAADMITSPGVAMTRTAGSRVDNKSGPSTKVGSSAKMEVSLIDIAFIDKAPCPTLLLCTDKHLVSLPLNLDSFQAGTTVANTRIRQRKKTPWDLRSTRRIDFGIPQMMTRDPVTGLLMLSVKIPSSEESANPTTNVTIVRTKEKDAHASFGKAGSKLSLTASKSAPTADSASYAFAVVDAHMKDKINILGLTSSKLTASRAQLYRREHLSAPIGACACTPCGRVVSVDAHGCVAIWSIVNDRLMSLQDDVYSPSMMQGQTPRIESATPVPDISANSRFKSDVNEPLAKQCAASAAAIGAMESPPVFAPLQEESPMTPETPCEDDDSHDIAAMMEPMSVDSKLVREAIGLTSAFERELITDPSAWSECSPDSKVASEYVAEETADQASSDAVASPPKESPAKIHVRESEDEVPANASLHSHAEEDLAEETENAPPSLTKTVEIYDDDAIATHILETERQNVDRAKEVAEASRVGVGEVHAPSQVYLPSYSLNDLMTCVPQMMATHVELHHGAFFPSKFGVTMLGLQYVTAPSVSNRQRKMVVSDGSMICVKSLDGVTMNDELIPRPSNAPNTIGLVVSAVLSPSCLFIAAIVESTVAGCHHLIVWFNDLKKGEWRCVGGAGLGVPLPPSSSDSECANAKPYIDWVPSDNLVVLVPIAGSTPSPEGEIVVSVISAAEILKGQLAETLQGKGSAVELATDGISGMRAVQDPQFLDEDFMMAGGSKTPQHISIVVWGGARVFLISASLSYNREVEVTWTDDIGPKGPFIAFDLSAVSAAPAPPVDKFLTATKSSASKTSTEPKADGFDPNQGFALAAALDSFGGVRVAMIALKSEARGHPAQKGVISKAVYAHVAANHVFGDPRNLCLSPTTVSSPSTLKNGSHRIKSNLVVSSTGAMRIFSLHAISAYGKPLTVQLSLLHKLNISVQPDFMMMLPVQPAQMPHLKAVGGHADSHTVSKYKSAYRSQPAAVALVPDVIVANADGDMALVSCVPAGADKAELAFGEHHAYVDKHDGQKAVCLPIQSSAILKPSGKVSLGVGQALLNVPVDIRASAEGSLRGSLESFVPATTPVRMATCTALNLVALLANGSLNLFHTISGIKTPLPSPFGASPTTALAASPHLLALGGRCGRVCVFDASTMRPIVLLSPPVPSTQPSNPAAAPTSDLRMSQDSLCRASYESIPAVFETAVESMYFLRAGNAVIVTHRDGRMFAAPVNAACHCPSGTQVPIMPATFNESSSQAKTCPMKIIECAGDEEIFGVLRFGYLLEVFRVPAADSAVQSAITVQPVFTGILRDYGVEPLLPEGEGGRTGSRSTSRARAKAQAAVQALAAKHGRHLSATHVHMMRGGHWITIAAIATSTHMDYADPATEDTKAKAKANSAEHKSKRNVVKSTQRFLLTGAVRLLSGSTDFLIQENKEAYQDDLLGFGHIQLHRRMLVDSHTTAVAFSAQFCGIATPQGVCVFNLHALNVSKSAAAPADPEDDEAASAYFQHFIRFAGANCAGILGRDASEISGGSAWDDVCISLSVCEKEIVPAEGDHSAVAGDTKMATIEDAGPSSESEADEKGEKGEIEEKGDAEMKGHDEAGEGQPEAKAETHIVAPRHHGHAHVTKHAKMDVNLFVYKPTVSSLLRLGVDV